MMDEIINDNKIYDTYKLKFLNEKKIRLFLKKLRDHNITEDKYKDYEYRIKVLEEGNKQIDRSI